MTTFYLYRNDPLRVLCSEGKGFVDLKSIPPDEWKDLPFWSFPTEERAKWLRKHLRHDGLEPGTARSNADLVFIATSSELHLFLKLERRIL